MRKEIILAIIAGITFGLVIAFGVWRVNLAFKPSQNSLSPQASPGTVNSPEFGITIAKPEKDAVLTESPTTLSGVTKPNALVVISVPEKDYTLRADRNGSFEQQITLTSGLNEVVVTAFNENGDGIENRFLVVYSTEFAKQ